MGERAPADLNEHWRPVEYLCSPSLFCPHFIGHVETFQEDSSYVLSQMNMTWLQAEYDHKNNALHQMKILAEDNFRQLDEFVSKDKEFYRKCANTTGIAARLWKAFQMYGYLPNDVKFPEKRFKLNPNLKRFLDIVSRVYFSIPEKDRKKISEQREAAVKEAYSSVSIEVLERIAQMYLYEFLTFKYEMRPSDIFSDRYDSMS